METLKNLLEQLYDLGEETREAVWVRSERSGATALRAEKSMAEAPARKAALLREITAEVERLISAGTPEPHILDSINDFLRGAGEVS